MQLTVLLFGPYADAVERSSVTLDLPSATACTAGAVMARLAESHPCLRAMLPVAQIAINQQFAQPDQPVHDRDEVAIIGMVGGG